MRMLNGLMAVGASLTLLSGCASCDGGPGPADGGVDPLETGRKAMLASEGEFVVLPVYRAFAEKAHALDQAAGAWAAAIGTADETVRRDAARAAFREAMGAWQEAELLQFGPAGMAPTFVGGEAFRDRIYAWPTISACRVDEQLVAAQYAQPGYFDTALTSTYGLAALEYLMFYERPENSCPSQVEINAGGSWAALSADELKRRRADYSAAAAGHLAVTADALVAAWDPAQGNFLAELASAGEEGSAYSTARMATDELFAAIFYLDEEVKDLKLAIPAGLSLSCSSDVCPEALESPYARLSKQNLLANLRGFRRAFLGNAPDETARPGFDDLLVDVGAPELAATMVTDLDAAIAELEGISGSLEDSLARNPEELRNVYTLVKKVTDAVKTQMPALLSLRVPGEGPADND